MTEAAELVVRAQGGDTLAMNELLAMLAPYVGRICGPIALDAGPDAAQEALIVIFRSLRTPRESGALHGWARTELATLSERRGHHDRLAPGAA